jgi:hypothetical protein
MRNVEFESGVVYERRSQLYLAVDNRTLITYQRGEWVEVRPYVKYKALRDVSVGHLCKGWSLTSAQFDEHVSSYFCPKSRRATEDKNPRRRSWDDGQWKRFRTFRHAV